MASGILGMGSSASAGLNQELIDRLKTAEAKGTVGIYDKKLENIDKETEIMGNITTKINELLAIADLFDVNRTSANSFDQVTATTSGSSVVFDAVDVSGLQPGTNSINVTQLSQKDVYQSNIFTDSSAIVSDGVIHISIDGTMSDFVTDGKTYEELASDINGNENFTASIEQVGDDDYRLVIKSTNSGVENALTITQDGVDLGFEDGLNKVLSAQNMLANIDGVDYDVSSNTVTIQGNLKMTAIELGASTISIQKDTTSIIPNLNDMVSKYNELVTLVDNELYSSTDSPISDPGSLRMIMSHVKDTLFGSYGEDDDLNVFSYGFSIDRSGFLSIDEDILGNALSENPDDIRSLFVGTIEKPGMGNFLKDYLDGLDGYEGLLTSYSTNIVDKKSDFEADKIKAQEVLDNKYKQMSLEFASYTAIITQMENAFGGLKLMIDQSTAR